MLAPFDVMVRKATTSGRTETGSIAVHYKLFHPSPVIFLLLSESGVQQRECLRKSTDLFAPCP